MLGEISYEPLNVQGLFINICALYWQRDGKLSVEEINKRYKALDELTELTDRFISVSDGFISVKFLDEQLSDAGHVSKVNSKNGSKGGRPKGSKTLGNTEEKENKPTALLSLNEIKAKKSQQEQEKDIYRRFLHLSISNEDYNKLFELYTKQQIDSIFDDIENYKKNSSYKSLFLTAKKWLKKNGTPMKVKAESAVDKLSLFGELAPEYLEEIK